MSRKLWSWSKRRHWCALLACAALTTGTACSVPGAPQPADRRAERPTSSAPQTSSRSIDPCTLLTPTALAPIGAGFAAGKPPELDLGGRACGWKLRPDDPVGDIDVVVTVWDQQSVESVNDAGDGVQTGSVNGRRAARVPVSETGGCIIALRVAPRSRVDVSITMSTLLPVQRACEVAEQAADLVEPQLPPAV